MHSKKNKSGSQGIAQVSKPPRRVKALPGIAVILASALVSTACGTAATEPAGQDSDQQPPSSIQEGFTTEQIVELYGSSEIGDSWHGLELGIIADRARGGSAAAEALGQKYVGISANFDPIKQLGDIRSAVASGLPAFNAVPLEAASVNSIAPEAVAAGVPFVASYNTPAWKTPGEFGEEYIGFYTADDFQTGVITAEKMFEHIGGEGVIVHLRGLEGATADILRGAGIDSVAEGYPGIEIAARPHTNFTTVDGFEKMQTLLASLPQIDGVIAVTDDVGIGAYNAIKSAGLEIPVVSSDGSQQVFDLIESSFYLGTVDTYTAFMGGFLFVRAFDALHGWRPEPAESMMYTPIRWVDKTNARSVVDEVYGDTIPYDFTKMSRVLYPDDWELPEIMTTMDPDYLWQVEPKPSGYQLPPGFSAEDRAVIDDLYSSRLVR